MPKPSTSSPIHITIQKYLGNYPITVIQQVQSLFENDKLVDFLLQRHPMPHCVYNDNELREYVLAFEEIITAEQGDLRQ